MTKFNLVVNIEVIEDKGEDANLFDADFRENLLIGVFDGLGGRSAGYDRKTGGRIASEVASQISKKFFKQWNGKITPENVILLQQEICSSLKILADTNMPKTSSRLKGSLMEHRLCTTIALASIPKQQGQEKIKIFEADLAWMGDSRIYFLSPTKGLQQLTKDDLKSPKDALEMLRQDPPMSQFLTADLNPRWQIHYQRHRIEEPGCFLACTDGCFQYFSAPWEFEKLLLEMLYKSEGDTMEKNTWQQLIKQRYTEIKQDDVSLILYPGGFNGIKHLKSSYQERLQYLQENFMPPTANARYEDVQTLWEKYRIDYEYYFQFIQYTEPPANFKPSFSEDKSSLVISTTSNLSRTDQFKEISDSSRQKAASKAEEIQSLLDRANSCYENNQLKEAENFCHHILKIDAHHSECKYLLGLIYTQSAFMEIDCYRKQQLFQNAALYWKNEVLKNPGEKLIHSYRHLGFIYYKLSQWQKAVDSYQSSFKPEAAEQLNDWEEHLEAFVISLNLISNKYETANLAIQLCQKIANSFSSENKAYAYYFMAVLQEIKGELYPALISIQEAVKIYNSSYSSGVKYEKLQKARQKHQEIQNKYYYHRSY
ncbi:MULTISPECIES: protein phosphatase 2C domain-containing protein [unclassified Microcoleus]|uniref:protein phosphatase 2C domain-containing protein n=1 Tax=unclassified Microcoleus TaxID=2642155 RepID=UPI0025CED68E|nr:MULTISPECIES: protein phosphatase 2C domain-containing protein [unclassified Microcoleus]